LRRAGHHCPRVAGLCVSPFKRAMSKKTIIRYAAVLVLVVVGLAFAAPAAKRKAQLTQCGNYLVSIGCAARLWADDHGGDQFPPDLISMSNEVVTPKIYVCPGDYSSPPAASWASFTPKQSSFEVVTPSLHAGDTNRVFLRCKVHGSVLYGDGSVYVRGQLHHKF
jgi:hypothetical protein